MARPPSSSRAAKDQETIDVRIAFQAIRPSLHEKSGAIADLILHRPTDVMGMTINELADEAGASVALVAKLLQQVGVPGFGALKISLARAFGAEPFVMQEDLELADGAEAVVQKIFGASVQALQDTMKMLAPEALEQAVALLGEARTVQIYGIGSAAPIAVDAHYRMMRIGLPALALVDSHLQVSAAALAGEGTTILTISHSGRTVETLSATRLARANGARVVVITGQPSSPLRELADVVLQTYAQETRFAKEAMTSRIAQLAIVDALIAALALGRYDTAVDSLEKTYGALAEKRV